MAAGGMKTHIGAGAAAPKGKLAGKQTGGRRRHETSPVSTAGLLVPTRSPHLGGQVGGTLT